MLVVAVAESLMVDLEKLRLMARLVYPLWMMA